MPTQPIDPRVLELLLRGRGTENIADDDRSKPGSMFDALLAAGDLQYGYGAPQQAGLNYLGGAPTPRLQEDEVAMFNQHTNRGVGFRPGGDTGQYRSAGMLAERAFNDPRDARPGAPFHQPSVPSPRTRVTSFSRADRPSTPAGMARRLARRPR